MKPYGRKLKKNRRCLLRFKEYKRLCKYDKWDSDPPCTLKSRARQEAKKEIGEYRRGDKQDLNSWGL